MLFSSFLQRILLCLTWTFLCTERAQCQDSTTDRKNIKEIPNEYIAIFKKPVTDPSLQLVLGYIGSNHISNQQAKATTVRFLNLAFPYLGMDANALQSITEDRMVLTIKDPAKLEMAKKDPKFKRLVKNYIITTDFHDPTPITIPAEKADWGVCTLGRCPKNNTSSTKKVWLIDTGVDGNHTELNVDKSLSRSFVDGVNYDDVNGNEDWHGTHVAGIIGAKQNGVGIVGVIPNVSIVALKVIHKKDFKYAGYLDALTYVFEKAGAGDVLNLSIDETIGDPAEIEAIKDIASKGVFVVISAGNSQKDVDLHHIFPATITGDKIYAIASFDQGKTFSNFSNYGSSVSYCAPGGSITSCMPGNRYGIDSGTSMAAPHVTGILLLKGTINTDGQIKNNNTQDKKQNYLKAHE